MLFLPIGKFIAFSFVVFASRVSTIALRPMLIRVKAVILFFDVVSDVNADIATQVIRRLEGRIATLQR